MLSPQKIRTKSVFSRDPPTLSAAARTLGSLQASHQTREARTYNFSSPWGQRATITLSRSDTRGELPPVYPWAWNPSSQLLWLACLTTHTEPVLLGLHGERSHTGQRQTSENSSRVGIISYYYCGTEELQQPFWCTKSKFSSESNMLQRVCTTNTISLHA